MRFHLFSVKDVLIVQSESPKNLPWFREATKLCSVETVPKLCFADVREVSKLHIRVICIVNPESRMNSTVVILFSFIAFVAISTCMETDF